MKVLLLFTLIFFIFALKALSQDSIFKKNHEIIIAKILEVNEKHIKYKLFHEPDGPLFILPNSEIKRIQLSGGTVIEFNQKKNSKEEEEPLHELTDKEKILLEKQKAIMVDFFSPIFGHVGGGYQKLLNPKTIGEVKFGYIGLSSNENNDNDVFTHYGLYVSPSVKLKTDSDFLKYALIVINPLIGVTALLLNKNKKKLMHPLNTSYIKPQLSLAYKRTTETVFITNPPGTFPQQISRKADFNNYSAAINVCFGQQVILADFLLFDYFFGMGYGFFTKQITSGLGVPENEDFDYFHSHIIIKTSSVPLTFTGGFSFGILIK